MSAAKHTPGPWRVFDHSWSDTSILADGFDHAVCLLDINYATEESQDADEAVMAANARLIAAAPELLEALQRTTEMCESYADWIKRNVMSADIEQHPYLPELEGAAEDARAAIAKATGSQS